MYLDFLINRKTFLIEDVKLLPDENEDPATLHNASEKLILTNPCSTFAASYSKGKLSFGPMNVAGYVASVCHSISFLFRSEANGDEVLTSQNICLLFCRLLNAYLELLYKYEGLDELSAPDD